MIWQFLVIAGALLLFVESASWAEGTIFELARFFGFNVIFVVQHGYLRRLVGTRLERTRTDLKSIRMKHGEERDDLWESLSYVIKPDWWVATLQLWAIYTAVYLYSEYGVFDYSDQLGTYSWLLWLFIGWLAIQSMLRANLLDKVSEAYYRHMYLANTTPPDEGIQTHSHA